MRSGNRLGLIDEGAPKGAFSRLMLLGVCVGMAGKHNKVLLCDDYVQPAKRVY